MPVLCERLVMKKQLAALSAFGLLLSTQVHAAVPAAITTAIETMEDDGVTVATAFVVAAIAVAAIKFLRRAA